MRLAVPLAMTVPAQVRAAEGSLARLASKKGIYFGSAARIQELLQEDDLRNAIVRECACLTPEVEMSWNAIERVPARFNFNGMDALLAFAGKQGKQVHGHTLLWHGSVPDWAAEALQAKRGLEAVQGYLKAVFGRYRGVIGQWNVVNEPIETGYRTDGLRTSVFLKAFGPDYIPRALAEARQLAPKAKLLINEFSLEYGVRTDRDRRFHFLKLLESLKRAGAPLDGVGLQAHLDLAKGPLAAGPYSRFLRDIAEFGLFIVVTELDVKEYDYILPAEARDQRVADATQQYLEVLLAEPAVRGLSTWGLSDRHSWLQVTPEDFARYPNAWRDGTSPGVNRGLPFDSSMRRKPMYEAIARALA